MNQQQAHVDDASEQPDDGEAFGISLYQMEIDRVKYLLASYLRMRLRKIEKFVFHILGSEEEFSKLSPNEVEFASKYQEAVERHLKESCLDQIPDKFRSLAADDAGNTSLGTSSPSPALFTPLPLACPRQHCVLRLFSRLLCSCCVSFVRPCFAPWCSGRASPRQFRILSHPGRLRGGADG